MTRHLLPFVLLSLSTSVLPACGGGVPVRIRIDEFSMDLNLDEMIGSALGDLRSQGLIPAETPALPELWPQSLPAIQLSTVMASPPVPVDLTPPEDDPNFEKYKQINQAAKAIKRIELNRLILRIDASTLTINLPELRMQVADAPDADPADRLSWQTIGRIPGADPGFIGDLEFTFDPGGETYLNSQLADDEKEFALRIQGKLGIDTDVNPRLPAGAAKLRLIVAATFFVDPEGAAGAL